MARRSFTIRLIFTCLAIFGPAVAAVGQSQFEGRPVGDVVITFEGTDRNVAAVEDCASQSKMAATKVMELRIGPISPGVRAQSGSPFC